MMIRASSASARQSSAGEGLTLPLVNLAYGEGGCTYVPYGAVDRYGNWVATADGSVRQMTLPIQ